jgi:thiamine biosynthesis protein ThiS
MQLNVNGKQYEHQGDGSLQSLLKEIGATSPHVVFIVNNELIRWSQRDSVTLVAGDRVEVITIGAGG